jgi:hypothetical protein
LGALWSNKFHHIHATLHYTTLPMRRNWLNIRKYVELHKLNIQSLKKKNSHNPKPKTNWK